MWRAMFLAIGTFLIILGVQFLMADNAVLRLREETPQTLSLFEPSLGAKKTFTVQSWMPYSFMGLGAVICIYSFTLPKRLAGD